MKQQHQPSTETLAEMRLLAGLSEPQLQRIAAAAELVDYPEQAVIFREGDPTSYTHFIFQGSVALELCAPAVGCKPILTAGPGELIGWSALLGQPTYTATARVMEPLTAINISTPAWQTMFAEDYQLAYELMRRTALTLATRLHTARLQAVDIYGNQSPPATEPT